MNYHQTAIEELDTDVLLELILGGYDVGQILSTSIRGPSERAGVS